MDMTKVITAKLHILPTYIQHIQPSPMEHEYVCLIKYVGTSSLLGIHLTASQLAPYINVWGGE